ncbi:helix-turn-helix domain-containing protein [Taibaiella soli]|uniref:XRE family transcriptional regulator n=1 Tax=Taibaiella soli TaxID=1649169 RepID=A0A2W2A837_9BACT|nr:helix-turn-helix transcriptional regulator [Taibaiella soli]PZF71515.1 XRE family transcriptional regulator [Taibaiella soli]
MAAHKVHHGKNLRRFREWKGLKQEALAFEMGDDWSQKKISLLEQKEIIDDAILKQLSDVLKIPVEAFDALNEDPAINIIGSTFTESSVNAGNSGGENNSIVNPVDKWLEALKKNEELYERLLQAEKEKVALLEKLLKGQ